MLHTAIQKHQHYPSSAAALKREGRVTVKFMLHKNGNVSFLRVVASSGTDSLDEAAVSAIKAATPFANVAQYLDKDDEYSVDVIFKFT